MIKFKYKGRSFSSAQSLASAMQRDIQSAYEQRVRRAAANSGLSVRKTSQGLEVSGSATNMGRFYNRLGR
ncbi:hypothetical protein [Tabrizicola soli]|uniref:Uncharacterized protein n=1 Tax=Tabrizicola soli TaxID=2185115 RepID=A0ABV7E0Y0_9RHOB|nr:hypothetical protein [Tabrizicola soli]